MEVIQKEGIHPDLAHDIHIESGLKPDEVEAVLELAADSPFLPPDSLMAVEEMAWESVYSDGREPHTFLLARSGTGGIVGAACYGPIPYWTGNFELYGVGVTSGVQRRGIGTALVNEIKRRVGLDHGQSVFLEAGSGPDHEPLRLFYEANAFYHEHRFLKQFVPDQEGTVYRLDLNTDLD